MNLADIVYGPWMIREEMHSEIMAIYDRHVRGETANIQAIEATLGRKMDNQRKSYDVVDGVAILPLIGVIAKRANMFTRISGGVSTEIFGEEFKSALTDPDVTAIVINIDTPGGAVDGTPDLADMIYSARGQKPILAWSSGMVASAGIYIATAADRLYISSDVVVTGSIGVVTMHRDVSRAEDMRGIKTTEITSGKYKRIASTYSPLSEEGREDIQGRLDHIYSIFVESVAKYRGMSVDDVLGRAADGRIFLGKQGINAGLVDGIMTFDQVMAEARIMADGKDKPGQKRGKMESMSMSMSMTPEELEIKYPEAVAAIRLETEGAIIANMSADGVRNTAPAIWNAIRAQGAQDERDRIADVRANTLPGHEALVAAAEMDGKSTGADVAIAIVKAERELASAARDKQVSNANHLVPAVEEPDGTTNIMKRGEFDALPAHQKSAFLSTGGKVRD